MKKSLIFVLFVTKTSALVKINALNTIVTQLNEDIFSFRRIRLAPTLVLIGFGIQIYAILTRSKDSNDS